MKEFQPRFKIKPAAFRGADIARAIADSSEFMFLSVGGFHCSLRIKAVRLGAEDGQSERARG